MSRKTITAPAVFLAFLIATLVFVETSLEASEWVFNHNSSTRFTSPQKFRESWNFLLFMKGVLSFEEVAKSLLTAGVSETIVSYLDFSPPATQPSAFPQPSAASLSTGDPSSPRDGAMLVIDVGRPETPAGGTTLVNLKETTLPAGSEAYDMLANSPSFERNDVGSLLLDENGQPRPVASPPPSVPRLEIHTGISE